MSVCGVLNCKNNYYNTKKSGRAISFHRLPESKEIRLLWMKLCHIPPDEVPFKKRRICSFHFSDEDFFETRLLSSAVPSKFLPGDADDVKEQRETRKNLELQVLELKKSIEHLEAENARLNTEVEKYSLEANEYKNALEKILTPLQIHILTKGLRKTKWTHAEMAKAIVLKNVSSKAYELIQSEWNIPLPSERSIRRWCSEIDFQPGILHNILGLRENFDDQPCIYKRYSSQINFNLPVAESSTSAMGDKELSQYVLPLDQPISLLDCSDAFNGLESKEKLYAHYLSEASWYGGLATTVQTSHESSMIVSLLLDIFKSNGIEGLKTTAIQNCGFSEDDWRALLVYACGVFGNAGNYKSFGDTKIIPGVSVDKVERLVENAKFTGNQNVQEKWIAIKDKMYSLTLKEKQLGLGEKGTTTYFSENCTTEDGDLINRFMKQQESEAYITRLFKTVNGATTHYEIRAASEELDSGTPKVYDFEGAKITFTKGDYSPIMKRCADSLVKAKEYAANENEVKMLEKYIESFRKGCLDAHKEGSRFWIKDKGPAIEMYIGFIETYRDPYGTRGEFEGFVSIVNRAMSAKFSALVENAKSFLTLLPWPSQYEIENFQKPDFTSLDVLTFAGSGIPAGINIPNYTEIRQNEGFKNVSLGNVIVAGSKYNNIPFLSEEDKELFDKYRIESFEVQVGLHELLGHGSGKLMMKKADGSTNYPADLKNPLTNELIESMYEAGETYDSVFLSLGSAFEECRAESVGLLLSLNHDVLKIFGFEGEEAEKVIYVNWLSMIFAGVAKALEMYQPETKSWMQAHSQARFAIGQALIEAGEGLVDIKETVGADGKPDLLITLDRTKINTVGRKAISDFLLKIQVYRSLADVKSARQMFDHYTNVNDDGRYPWASWRDIIMEKKQPRKIYAQCNTSITDDSTVVLHKYEATHEGFIQSLMDRFSGNSVYEYLDYCWKKDKPYF